MKEFIISLKYLFLPRFWFMLENYCPVFDRYVRKCIKENTIELVDRYHCRMEGNYLVWIANYPYGSCSYAGKRASRLTIERLQTHIQKLRFENLKKIPA